MPGNGSTTLQTGIITNIYTAASDLSPLLTDTRAMTSKSSLTGIKFTRKPEKHPERWSGKTRNWESDIEVVLKKFKRLKAEDTVYKDAA